MTRDDQDDPGEFPYRRYGIPKLGFENYWYPIILASELRRTPKAVQTSLSYVGSRVGATP